MEYNSKLYSMNKEELINEVRVYKGLFEDTEKIVKDYAEENESLRKEIDFLISSLDKIKLEDNNEI